MQNNHDRASEALAAGSVTPGGDPLSNVLQTVKLTGALLFMVEASLPWGYEVPEARAFANVILPGSRHVISFHVITRGTGWICCRSAGAQVFTAGDILVLPHEDAYAMQSAPDTRHELTPDEVVAFFRAMSTGVLPPVVREGGGGPGGAQFICGFLGCDARPFNPLLAALPRLLHLRRPAGARPDLLDRLVEFALTEAGSERAGSACLRLRLSELMFIEVVRRHLETLAADETGWFAALRDPAIGHALALIHDRPAYPWTLAELAREAGLSRSMLAQRFTALVGLPPMHYLARWRIQLAARRLIDGRAKVAAVGAEVGYASEAAFSRAFRRIAGVAPAEWRHRSG